MNDMKMSETEFERQYAAATRSGEEELRKHPLAIAVDYSRRLRKVRVSLNNGCLFVFPPELVQGLASATPKQLAEVRILSPGTAIDWPTLDVQCQITSLLSGIFGTRRWMADLGRKGGRAKSPAKTAAARENGKRVVGVPNDGRPLAAKPRDHCRPRWMSRRDPRCRSKR